MADEYEELRVLQVITNEAKKALDDKSMTIDNSEFSSQFKKVLSTDSSTSLEFKDFATALGILVTPTSILGGLIWGGTYLIHKNQQKKIQNEKLNIYKEAVRCQNGIIKALIEERNADKKRIDLLTSINKCLTEALEAYDAG